jgi:hypothetical protein
LEQAWVATHHHLLELLILLLVFVLEFNSNTCSSSGQVAACEGKGTEGSR